VAGVPACTLTSCCVGRCFGSECTIKCFFGCRKRRHTRSIGETGVRTCALPFSRDGRRFEGEGNFKRREGGRDDRPRRSFGGEDRPRREFNSDRPRREGGLDRESVG
ncbi:hypothetical protein ECE26_13100, partial [Acinetobacter baumannii]|uniref:hypothetical protein n=1 Tax=Acinetobacter baumannii TaxID=470 RepID=UPI002278FB28